MIKNLIKLDRFIRKIQVWIKYYNIIRWYISYCMRDLLSDLNNYAWHANSDMRHIR